jgi:hypothetical protein
MQHDPSHAMQPDTRTRLRNCYSLSTIGRALDLYRAGYGRVAIARRMGLPESTVQGWIAAAGIARPLSESIRLLRRHQRQDQAAEPWRESALRLYAAGLSCKRVGVLVGRHERVVYRFLVAEGKIRPRGEAQRRVFAGGVTPEGRAYRERIAEAGRLASEGLRPADIARAMELDPKTIAKYLRSPLNPYLVTETTEARQAAGKAPKGTKPTGRPRRVQAEAT